MCSPFVRWPALLWLLPLSGCLSPWNTRFPQFWQGNSDVERRAYQVQDPYPDSRQGPDTGVRPLGFEVQRSEPQVAKDRGYSGFLRWRTQEAQRLNSAAMQAQSRPPGAVIVAPPPANVVVSPYPVAMPPAR